MEIVNDLIEKSVEMVKIKEKDVESIEVSVVSRPEEEEPGRVEHTEIEEAPVATDLDIEKEGVPPRREGHQP